MLKVVVKLANHNVCPLATDSRLITEEIHLAGNCLTAHPKHFRGTKKYLVAGDSVPARFANISHTLLCTYYYVYVYYYRSLPVERNQKRRYPKSSDECLKTAAVV